jgi:Zn-dependent protease
MDELSLMQKLAVWALPVLFAITLHEAAHGWAASKLGDPTAKMLGRVSINPIRHIDPIGTLVVPALLLLLGGFLFGWAKSVPITLENFKKPPRDMAIVAMAGPAANVLMVIAWAVVLKVGFVFQASGSDIGQFLVYTGVAGVSINLILIILNLLPLPPLDGSRIAAAFMSKRVRWNYYRLEPIGIFILLGLLLVGVLGPILMVPYTASLEFIYTVVTP